MKKRCPTCNGKLIKNGIRQGRQRYICTNCKATPEFLSANQVVTTKSLLNSYALLKKKLLTGRETTRERLCRELACSDEDLTAMLDSLRAEKYLVKTRGNAVKLENTLITGGESRLDLSKMSGEFYKIGFIADNHLCSKFERLDVLNALYDYYEQEGVSNVYNAGNWIDGEARFNQYEVHTRGITNQIEYFLNAYPQRKGVTTYFVAGDDHEGWYVQRERINIGEYMQLKAEERGRDDLKYLSYLEHDVELKAKRGSAIMKIMHAGGGTAYALSYSPQKIIESYSSGEKPAILLLGHYHKFDFLYYMGVYCVQCGTTQDQTTFMRKRKIQAYVGGGIMEIKQSPCGSIDRVKVEWFSFQSKKYYAKNGYYLR